MMLYNLPKLQTKIIYLLIYLLTYFHSRIFATHSRRHRHIAGEVLSSEQCCRREYSYPPLCAIAAIKIITAGVQ